MDKQIDLFQFNIRSNTKGSANIKGKKVYSYLFRNVEPGRIIYAGFGSVMDK